MKFEYEYVSAASMQSKPLQVGFRGLNSNALSLKKEDTAAVDKRQKVR